MPIDKVFEIAERLGHKQSLSERKCRLLVSAGLVKCLKNKKGNNVAYILAITHLKAPQTQICRPVEAIGRERYKKLATLKQDSLLGLKLPQYH